MADGLRVAVAGAGIGGLCLAQGLARAGADVRVFERDAGLGSRRQGYRLHVDSRAGLSLRRCLPPELFRLFLDTTGRPSTKVTVLSARLRVRHTSPAGPDRDPDDPATLSTSADRGVLREILARGLGPRIRFGCAVAGFEQDAQGVTVRFADGSTDRADVLVGADGVGSAVRAALLPSAAVVDTGVRVIYGKTPLAAAAGVVPAAMWDGFTAIVGRRLGMAAGIVRFRRPATAITPDDYVMWGLSGRRFPAPDAAMAGMDAAGLHAVARAAIRRWHPDVRALLGAATVGETFLIRVRTSAPVRPWPPSRVTVLGDAIHAMSPAGGSGANTALLDAAHLCDALTGGGDVIAAIGAYEDRMRAYGFPAENGRCRQAAG